MPLIPEGCNLFIVDLEYTAPLEQIEPLMAEHMVFVNKGYETGLFLASGPKVPRSGGIILAVSNSKEKLEKLLEEDPFHTQGVVRYSVTEFHPRRTVAGFD
ncbi:MAG: hypothetical protein JKY57_05210 [Kordiimonadaceae bacterium]|nr:hypothetical protein [Kordiimonadaceae bacterium]